MNSFHKNKGKLGKYSEIAHTLETLFLGKPSKLEKIEENDKDNSKPRKRVSFEDFLKEKVTISLIFFH